MTKTAVVGAFLAMACDPADRPVKTEDFQGIVELEERRLAFEVSGRVHKLSVQEGDLVGAGDALVHLDDTLENLQREARSADARVAEAQLAMLRAGSRPQDIKTLKADLGAAKGDRHLAERNLERARKLKSGGSITEAEFDSAEASLSVAIGRATHLEQQIALLRDGARREEIDAASAHVDAAKAAVRSSEERIRRHVLHADEASTVLDVFVELGEFTGIGAAVVTLADVAHPYVDIFVPEGRIAEVAVGDPMSVRVDAHERPFEGRVEHISRRAEFTPKFLFSARERPNLVIRVRIRIDDADGALRAGVPAFVRAEDRP